MPDKLSEPLTDPNNEPVTFVSEVAGIGVLNGVVNVTFSQARYMPHDSVVMLDQIVASRLRFDLYCAQRLHDMLGKILDENTKGAAQPKPKMDS